MADFSVRETQLSAPQGAGTGPVQAVQSIPSGILEKLTTVGDIFAKGLINSQKEDAEKRKQSIVNQYIRNEASINDAIAGGMSASEASVRSKANFNKFAANHGEYIGDFEKAGKALRGFTDVGEAVDEVKAAAAERTKDIDLVRAQGMIIPPGTTKADEQVYIDAAKTAVRTQKEAQAFYAQQSEIRADDTHAAAVKKLKGEEFAEQQVNAIAASQLQVFQTRMKTLSGNVLNGAMTQAEAQQELSIAYSNIKGAIASASKANPGLANLYSGTFSELYTIGLSSLDPKLAKVDYKEQFDQEIAKVQLSVIAKSPKIRNAIAVNKAMGNNIDLAILTGSNSREAIALLSNTHIDSPDYVPQVVGNPDIEKPTFTMAKKGLADLQAGKGKDLEVAATQAANLTNQLLKQTGETINKTGMTPAMLTESAAFIASPEFGAFAKTGKLSAEAAKTASQVFDAKYVPVVVETVQKKLDGPVPQGLYLFKKGKEKTQVSDVVDIKFNGSGISFEAKGTDKLDDGERRNLASVVDTLKSAQAGVNQLIQITAHLQQRTDYRNVWEENKHIWMPTSFPDPAKLAVGNVVDGWKYIGGKTSDRNSWQKQ